MDYFLRMYLPLYLLLYLTVTLVLPSYKTWKQTGINPITFGKADTAHDYIGFVMKVLIALLIGAVLCYSVGGKAYQFTGPIVYLQTGWLKVTGLTVVHIALLWIIIAQYQMGTSWRIGIDEENKTALKTGGIFSISRNPVFLGMMVSVLGVFFILPNTINFSLTLSTYFIIQIQIRLEETFLAKEHGQIYADYKQKVRRLI